MKKLYATIAAGLLAMPALFAQNPEALYIVGTNLMEDGQSLLPGSGQQCKLTQTEDGIYEGVVTNMTSSPILNFNIFTDGEATEWAEGAYVGAASGTQGQTTIENGMAVIDVPFKYPGSSFTVTKFEKGATANMTIDWPNHLITIYDYQPGAEIPDDDPSVEPTPTERKLYLVGAPQGWNIDESDMYLEWDNEANAFTGELYIPARKFQFRFYQSLGDWETGSRGPLAVAEADGDFQINITDDIENDTYQGFWDYGKGGWEIPTWKGGYVYMFVDDEEYLRFDLSKEETGEGPEPTPDVEPGDTIWIVGNFENWQIDNSDYPLSYNEETGNYTGTYNVKGEGISVDGENYTGIQFRFYTALGNWDTNSIGSQVADSPILFGFTDGAFVSNCVEGKGTWAFEWTEGSISFEVNLADMTVGFYDSEAGVALTPIASGIRYANGVVSAPAVTTFTVYNTTGKAVARANGESININTLPAGVYVVKAEGFAPVKVVK